MMREVPPHCVLPTQQDSRGKWGWGSCASMGQKIRAKLLRHGLVILCCLNIPSRTTVQQQHVFVMSTGFKTPQTVPQLLVTPQLRHMGTTVMLAWRIPACPLPDNPNLDAFLLPQVTVHHVFSCVICWLPCPVGFLQDDFHGLAG